MASTQSKEAINSVLRWGPLVANEGTFVVPFNHRQEVIVALQHSRWHGGCVVALHAVWPEQLVVQPAVHFKLESSVSFFSCKGNSEWERPGPIQVVVSLKKEGYYACGGKDSFKGAMCNVLSFIPRSSNTNVLSWDLMTSISIWRPGNDNELSYTLHL